LNGSVQPIPPRNWIGSYRQSAPPRSVAAAARRQRAAAPLLIERSARTPFRRSAPPSIEALARSIAGDTADLPPLDLARQIAEAQVELQRARAHKLRLIASAYADPADEPRETPFRQLNKARMVLKSAGMEILPFPEQQSLQGPEKMAAVLDDLTPELIRLDRYERRALSQRKFAVREFEAHCLKS